MMPSRNELAKIHIAKKELGLSDEQYRDILAWKFKKTSAKDLNSRQVARLLNDFRARGWKPRRRPRDRAQQGDPQSRKIRALWLTLAEMGVLRDSSERALAAYVKRMVGVDDLRFVDAGRKRRVIESLKKWIARAEDTPAPGLGD